MPLCTGLLYFCAPWLVGLLQWSAPPLLWSVPLPTSDRCVGDVTCQWQDQVLELTMWGGDGGVSIESGKLLSYFWKGEGVEIREGGGSVPLDWFKIGDI